MAFRLPPLSSLRVFEAAARHKSFRKAADELNPTASAVGHGIQTPDATATQQPLGRR
jgi:LysR family transcriptional regulator, glycine cleavage system transcriptional activator